MKNKIELAMLATFGAHVNVIVDESDDVTGKGYLISVSDYEVGFSCIPDLPVFDGYENHREWNDFDTHVIRMHYYPVAIH